MITRTRRLAITGATGYVGRALVQAALAERWQVRALARTRLADERVEFVPYDLGAELRPEALRDVDAVVHLAADTKAGSAPDVAREQEAARRLFAAASAGGIRAVFVSSQAARSDAPSDYGRSKWLIEQDALACGVLVVRPGLVYGGPERGLFGVLCQLVRRFPILPDLRPRPQVQPVHVDDLAQALIRLLDGRQASGCYNVASAKPVSFTGFLQAIATHRIARPRLFIPVPILALFAAMRLGKALLGPASDPDRLRSLRDLALMATRHDLERLGLQLRSLEAGMAAPRRPRRLLLEARAMLRYVLCTRPSAGLVRRYVRAVEDLQDGAPLPLPWVFACCPAAIALLDRKLGPTQPADRLGMRVEIATLLAESTPQGAERFLGSGGSRLGASLTVVAALSGEASLRLLRLPLTPWLRRSRARIARTS